MLWILFYSTLTLTALCNSIQNKEYFKWTLYMVSIVGSDHRRYNLLSILSLDLSEIRYRVQIFGADFGCSYG